MTRERDPASDELTTREIEAVTDYYTRQLVGNKLGVEGVEQLSGAVGGGIEFMSADREFKQVVRASRSAPCHEDTQPARDGWTVAPRSAQSQAGGGCSWTGKSALSFPRTNFFMPVGTRPRRSIAAWMFDGRKRFSADDKLIIGAFHRPPQDVDSWLDELPNGRPVVATVRHGREAAQGVAAGWRPAGIQRERLPGRMDLRLERERYDRRAKSSRRAKEKNRVNRGASEIDVLDCPGISRFINPNADEYYLVHRTRSNAAR